MPRLWPWLLRVGAVSIVVFLIIATPVGIVGYRATRQAAMIAELEQLGCNVSLSFGSTSDSPMEILLSLVMLGDFTSTYLAILQGVDPMPVQVLTQLKQRLRA